jgi:hypothetical protein
VRRDGERIAIGTDVFARQVALRFEGVVGAVLDDDHFDLAPGQERVIRIMDAAGADDLTVRAPNAEPITVRWKP